jgi:hypothetical protein
MKAKLLHALGHGVIMALQFTAQYSDMVPGKYKTLALGVGMTAQAVLGILGRGQKSAQ